MKEWLTGPKTPPTPGRNPGMNGPIPLTSVRFDTTVHQRCATYRSWHPHRPREHTHTHTRHAHTWHTHPHAHPRHTHRSRRRESSPVATQSASSPNKQHFMHLLSSRDWISYSANTWHGRTRHFRHSRRHRRRHPATVSRRIWRSHRCTRTSTGTRILGEISLRSYRCR